MRTAITTLLLLVFTACALRAQLKQDTVLPAVRVTEKRKPSFDQRLSNFSAGQQVVTIDTGLMRHYAQQNMATLLSQQMPVFVKAYSFNGLSTLGFRGASAAQSVVMWNGIPVQNAALGTADISTLPVLFFGKANVVYGGSGALFGSGNVGGALMLENGAPVFMAGHRELMVSGGMGSFGQYSGGLKGVVAGRKWHLSANTFAQTAANNYTYTTAAGNKEKMPNSSLQSGALMARAACRADRFNTFDVSVWAQQYDRRIPPALFEPYSAKQQQDKSLRIAASWQHVANSKTIYARAGLFNDAYSYTDPAVQLASRASVYQYYQEAGITWTLSRHSKLLAFVPVQLAWMGGGTDSQRQRRAALAGAYTLQAARRRLEASVQLRAEQIDDKRIFLPGAGATFRATEWLLLRANGQRTYRLPTLNELYYFPGGNAALRPEQGWSADGGYSIAATHGSLRLYHSASIFSRSINDWIIWLGGAIWTPHNIARVYSRGTETDNKLTYITGNWVFHAGVSTSYVLATTANSYLPGDGSIDRQIPYTPRYNARANGGLSYIHFYINYNHTYTGYRFITTDESAWLEPYNTGNLYASYSLFPRKRELQLNVQCNNLWNAQYSVAGYRPMPGRNWLAGFRLTL